MVAKYLSYVNLENDLKEVRGPSLDYAIFLSGSLIRNIADLESAKTYLAELVRSLKPGGILFVQGLPAFLPELGVYLRGLLKFKYWIALDSIIQQPTNGLPSAHAGILIFSKGASFNIEKTKFPHQYCPACGKTVKDWGGKSHLMHPDGYAVSDVWRDLPKANNYDGLSRKALKVCLQLVGSESKKGLVVPKEGVLNSGWAIEESKPQYILPGFDQKNLVRVPNTDEHKTISQFTNIIHQGDILEVLKNYPDESVDLVFADPPYNLEKNYQSYDDALSEREYIEWCNAWLSEYARILKPSGSLYVLNLPKWAMHHAKFLNTKLYFQNWIVWDALSEPRGKIMPAHYSLLFYTKSPQKFTFNLDQVSEIQSRQFCLRASCISNRKLNSIDDRDKLVDIWSDVHRIKHKRDRDIHPCQLPVGLLERIIRLSTKEGDIVLDGFIGAGTTAVVAARLGRKFVGIELDPHYVDITRAKIMEVSANGFVSRNSVKRIRNNHSKKELQLELRSLARKLGRLPTPDDVEKNSIYDLAAFYATFPSWGKALKAAKLEAVNGRTP